MFNYHLYNQELLLVVWGDSGKSWDVGPKPLLFPFWWPALMQPYVGGKNL